MSLTMVKNPNKKDKTQNNVNRWNLLPDDIIDNVLSRLTLPDGFEIDISDATFNIKLPSSIDEDSQFFTTLENFITIFTSPSTNFCLQFSIAFIHNPSFKTFFDNSSTHQLLRRCNIQHLEITHHGVTCGTLNSLGTGNLFRMHSLVSLGLDLSKEKFAWKLPSSINLPNLKKLSLSLIDFSDLERIIRNCPSLEDLTIAFVKVSKGNVMISTDKLKQLRMRIYWFSDLEVTINAPNLEHLDFGYTLIPVLFEVGSVDLCMRLVDSVSYVKSLVLDLNARTRFYNSPNKTNFPNLIHLTLILGSFERFEALGTVLDCPNLEMVVLKVTDFRWTSLVPNAVTFSLFKRVKRLELDMKVVRFEKQLLNLATYLLRSSPVLETLSLSAEHEDDPYRKVSKVDIAQFFRSLHECSMISQLCQIEYLGAYKSIQLNLERM